MSITYWPKQKHKICHTIFLAWDHERCVLRAEGTAMDSGLCMCNAETVWMQSRKGVKKAMEKGGKRTSEKGRRVAQ